ncbi:MAG: tyrosine-protein phosphatase [Candidatus Hydrogenedentes bacterium]|nr:tyrosine-protein phosphatase [Candidatus Hydrogenedentota bacterium]
MARSIARTIPVVFALAVIAGTQSCSILRSNLQTVEPGQFYRSGQMYGIELDAAIGWKEIKTVVNLRGENPDESWYSCEVAVCEQNDVAHHDLSWTMRRIPTPESLLQLIDWINSEPRPILVHCQAGVHRAAVASAVYRLLRGDSVEEAREEFGIFFMDAPIGALLDLYDESKPFEKWAREDYPAIYAAYTAE